MYKPPAPPPPPDDPLPPVAPPPMAKYSTVTGVANVNPDIVKAVFSESAPGNTPPIVTVYTFPTPEPLML